MQGIQINEAKAPWVMFERRAEEDRAASIQEGRFVAKDVDYVLVTPHGSRDQIERVVSEWFEYLQQQVGEGRFEQEWLRRYQAGYENWKAGKEIPLEGTPVLNWPLLSPAQVKMLQDLHILTVEGLAGCNEEAIRRLGMGGRNLVNKAQEFLKQQTTGKSTEEVVALRQLTADLSAQVKLQSEQLNTLMAQLQTASAGAGNPANANQTLEHNSPGVGLGDLLDAPTQAKRKL